jgi:hypothetical protein
VHRLGTLGDEADALVEPESTVAHSAVYSPRLWPAQ